MLISVNQKVLVQQWRVVLGFSTLLHQLIFAVKEPEETVTKRTVDGALGILRACLKSKTVKRVVYTSSGSTHSFSSTETKDVVDESDWLDWCEFG